MGMKKGQTNNGSFKKGVISYMKGKKHSKETRLKIGLAGIGRIMSMETRIKMSKSRIGKRLGIKQSEIHREKNRLGHLGQKPWNKGLKGVQICSKETRIKISLKIKGKKHSEESKRKMSISKIGNKCCLGKKHSEESKLKVSGENSCRYIKDRTKLKTDRLQAYDYRYKCWMLEVKKRDNWKCKINNKDCSGRLEAHHICGWIDHPELRYDINNGITLCLAHHPRKRAEEKRLSPYFKDLVSVSKVSFDN